MKRQSFLLERALVGLAMVVLLVIAVILELLVGLTGAVAILLAFGFLFAWCEMSGLPPKGTFNALPMELRQHLGTNRCYQRLKLVMDCFWSIILMLTAPLLVAMSVGGIISLFEIVLLVALVCANDIGAYMIGRKWGKRKFRRMAIWAPSKTIEGYLGGILTSTLTALAIVIAAGYGLERMIHINLFMLIMTTWLFADVGDLLGSIFKRLNNIKDSGEPYRTIKGPVGWLEHAIQSHGGFLDRLGSIAVAVFAYLMYWGLYALFSRTLGA